MNGNKIVFHLKTISDSNFRRKKVTFANRFWWRQKNVNENFYKPLKNTEWTDCNLSWNQKKKEVHKKSY